MHWKSNTVVLAQPKNNIFYDSLTESQTANAQLYSNLNVILLKDGNKVINPAIKLPSIWARDYFPINVDGKFIKFMPCMNYMTNAQRKHYNMFDFSQMKGIIRTRTIKHFNLILDGGNVIFNKDTLLVSDRVFAHNHQLLATQVLEILKTAFNDRKIIILKTEAAKYDPTGHIDGLCSFLDNDTLLVADYSQIDASLHRYNMNKILEHFNAKNVILLPMYNSTATYKDSGATWIDVQGNFINFLGTKHSLIFPAYPDKKIQRQVKKTIQLRDKMNRKIHFIDMSQVTKYGGAVHCISYDFFKRR
jgi:agmatine/peptidylarginine deiminase